MSAGLQYEPFFRPWQGVTYGSTDVRLLILGESHYGTNPPMREWTVDVVTRYIRNEPHEPWFRTFTNITQVVRGRRYSEIDRKEFWNSVSFYNYVQEVAAEFARGRRPTLEMFVRSQGAFQEVISEPKPTHILAMGVHLWRNMPPSDSAHEPLECQEEKSDCRYYATADSGHRALAIGIKHPSAGFSARAWYPLVRGFLSLTPRIRVDTSTAASVRAFETSTREPVLEL